MDLESGIIFVIFDLSLIARNTTGGYMNRYFQLTAIFLLFLVFFTGCAQGEGSSPTATPTPLSASTLPLTSTPLPTTTSTPVPSLTPTAFPQEDSFVVSQIFDFDDLSDLNYFFLMSPDGWNIENTEEVLTEGMLSFSEDSPLGFTNLKFFINFQTALHVRWKLEPAIVGDTCFSYALWPMETHDHPIDKYSVHVGGCTYNDLEVSLRTDQDEMISAPSKSEGFVLMDEDKWVEAVFWVEQGEVPILKVFAWDADNPDIYFIKRVELIDLEDMQSFQFSVQRYLGSMNLDFVKVISGDIESYLWFNAPAFSKQADRLMPLFHPVMPTESAMLDPTQAAQPASTQVPEGALREYEAFSAMIFELMTNYEDLPEKYRFYQFQQSVFDFQDGLQFVKTFKQGPTSSGGGLWLFTVVTVREEPFSDQNALLDSIGFDSNREQLHTDYPEVGEYSLSLYRHPFERYIFSKGNIMVDFHCNSVNMARHEYCIPANLAALGEIIFERLPENIEEIPAIYMEIPSGDGPEYFEDVWIDGDSLQWIASTWLPSLSVVMIHDDTGQIIYVNELIDISQLRVDSGEIKLTPGQASDIEPMLPGTYTILVLVDNQVAWRLETELGW